MPAYFIVQNTIKDEAQYLKYVQAVVPFIATFGGKLVARRAKVEVFEAEHDQRPVVMFEFPNMEAIHNCGAAKEAGKEIQDRQIGQENPLFTARMRPDGARRQLQASFSLFRSQQRNGPCSMLRSTSGFSRPSCFSMRSCRRQSRLPKSFRLPPLPSSVPDAGENGSRRGD